MTDFFLYPWRVEMKATPFSAYVVISKARTLDAALAESKAAKEKMRAYWVRVRPS